MTRSRSRRKRTPTKRYVPRRGPSGGPWQVYDRHRQVYLPQTYRSRDGAAEAAGEWNGDDQR
jgi:hypothetical protein